MKQIPRKQLLSFIVVGALLLALVGLFGVSNATPSAHAASTGATNGQQITFSCSHPMIQIDAWGYNQHGVYTHWEWKGFWNPVTTNNYWWVGTVKYAITYFYWFGPSGSIYVPASGSGNVTVSNC